MHHLARKAAAPLLVLAFPLLISACADLDRGDGYGGLGGLGGLGGYGRDSGRAVAYRCDNDRRFEASYRNRGDSVVVRTDDGTYRLDLKDRNGRERQYGDGDVRLYTDGDTARLRIKNAKDYNDCEARSR